MILHTHEHLPLPCSEDKLECSKFQMSKHSANKRFYHYVSPLPTATLKWLRRGACKPIHPKAYENALQI